MARVSLICTDVHFSGNSNLSEQCPICSHSPLSPAKPLKSLRLTILAFVKNIEKKREKERMSAVGVETPATPITLVAPPTPIVVSTQAVVAEKPDSLNNGDRGGAVSEPSNGATVTDEEANVVESVEQPAEAAEPSAEQDVSFVFHVFSKPLLMQCRT
jgi:hypothetical protein